MWSVPHGLACLNTWFPDDDPVCRGYETFGTWCSTDRWWWLVVGLGDYSHAHFWPKDSTSWSVMCEKPPLQAPSMQAPTIASSLHACSHLANFLHYKPPLLQAPTTSKPPSLVAMQFREYLCEPSEIIMLLGLSCYMFKTPTAQKLWLFHTICDHRHFDWDQVTLPPS